MLCKKIKKLLFLVTNSVFLCTFLINGMKKDISKTLQTPVLARDLIMIIDDAMVPTANPIETAAKSNDEQGSAEYPEIADGMDALMSDLFSALESQSAPILVSNKVWAGFAKARSNFYKNKDVVGTAHANFYNNFYIPLNTAVKTHTQIPNPTPESIAQAVNADFSSPNSTLKQKINTYIEELNKIYPDVTSIEHQRFYKDLACYCFPFDSSEWDLYTYKNVLYLLIPHTYIQRVSDNFPSVIPFKDSETNSPLNKQLAVVGFNSANLTPLTMSDAYNLPSATPKQDDLLDYKNGLPINKILITKENIAPYQVDVEEGVVSYYPFTWYVNLIGHGTFAMHRLLQVKMDQALKKMAAYKKEIDNLIGSIRATDVDTLIQTIQKELNNKNAKNKESLTTALEKAQSLKKLYQDNYELIFENVSINIAGMPAPAFSKLLKDFNTLVTTNSFFYNTCYSGARNLLFPYITSSGEGVKYNFTLVAAAIADVSTPQMSISLDFNKNSTEIIQPDHIKLVGTQAVYIPDRGLLDYKSFFDGLHTDELIAAGKPIPTFANLIRFISTKFDYDKFQAGLMPAIRLPGSSSFRVFDIDSWIQRITRVLTSVGAAEKNVLEIDSTKKHGVLLNSYYVPVPIHFKNGIPETIASGLYTPSLPEFGLNGYFFKEINIEGGSFYWFHDEILGIVVDEDGIRFESPASKVFLIDNFITSDPNNISTVNISKNMMFLNRVSLPKSITGFEPGPGVYATGALYTSVGKWPKSLYNQIDKLSNLASYPSKAYLVVTVSNSETGSYETHYLTETDLSPDGKKDFVELYKRYKQALRKKAITEGILKPIKLGKIKALAERHVKKIKEQKENPITINEQD